MEGRLKDRLLFEEHLEECSRCRLDVDALRRMQGRTRTWDEEEPYHQKRTYRPLFSGLAISIPILLVLGGLLLAPPRRNRTAPADSGSSPAQSTSHWETGSRPRTIQIAGQTVQMGPQTQLERVKTSSLRLLAGQLRIQEKGGKLTVETDQIQVQPIGTDFEVYHLNGLSRVHLNAGSLRVRQISDGKVFVLTRQQPEWPYIVIHPRLPVRTYPTAAPLEHSLPGPKARETATH